MFDYPEIGLYQKVTAVDFNRMGSFARAAMTAQVRQMVVPGLAFADFDVSYQGFQLTIAEGFIYKAGGQYRAAAPFTFNLVPDTPPTDGLKRYVSIVGYIVPAKSDDVERREFAVVVTPATNTTPAVYQNEPRQVETINRQAAQVAKVLGDSAPQPTPPSINPDQCEIARVVLTRAGIESVTIVEANRVPNLKGIQIRLNAVDDFVAGQGRRIDTLDKNLAALSAAIPTAPSDAMLRQMTSNLAILNEKTSAKTGDLAYGSDVCLDQRYTDNTVAGYAATVQDGIRFPWVAAKETPLSLFTPGDSAAKIVASLLLPAFDEEARVTVSGMDGSLSISNQIKTVTTAVQRTISRSSVRTGPPFTVCNNSAFWQAGTYNAATELLTRNGEVFTAQPTGLDWGIGVGLAPGSHIEMRLQQQWTDTWNETYWDQVTVQVGINGTIRAQTFKVPDFGYLTSIDLPFTQKDPTQGVTLLLLETSVGAPALKRVIDKCTLAPGDIVADAGGTVRTKFAFRPVFVDPGKLYSWATVTLGNYALATVKNNKFAEGTSFNSTDNGEFFAGDVDVDFAFTANFARFKAPRVELRMNDLDNVNGDTISALKFLYGSIVPAGTKIVHMARRSGGAWASVGQLTPDRTPPEEIVAGPFSAAPLPVSVQHKIVLIGTTTVMPAIDLTQAWATTLKIGNVLNHFTPVFNLGTVCNRGEIQVTVDGPFDPANHTVLAKLVVGGATVSPTAASPAIDPNKPGKRVITYSFSFADTTSLRLNISGTIASLLSTYHVDTRFHRFWKV